MRTVIIGIDGVPFSMLRDLSDSGVMKNFRDLREDGVFRKMHSSIPAVSSTSWSSIITGENPGEHGVYGFTDLIKGTYTLSFADFRKLKSPAFWQNNEGTYVVLNVPSTYPPKEMNGCHISGFVSPYLERAVYPQTHLQKLKEMNYVIDIDSQRAQQSRRLLFKQLNEALDARMKACRYFWDVYDWDVFKLVFTGSDRLEHFLWDAYENKKHEHHEQFLDFFRRIDEAIGEINNQLSKDESLIILSDHGMERVKYNVNPNALLIEKGLLKLGNSKKKYNHILAGTKAFAMEFGRVYVNKKGKYTRGSVENEKEAVEELIEIFNQFEINGEKVVKTIHKKEDIYKGKCVEDAPDLVLVPNKGFNLRGKITEKTFEKSPFTGMHNPEAFLFVRGNVNVPKEPTVEDVVPILNEVRK